MVHDFLFELGCEELPSGSVWPLAQALANTLCTALDKAQIVYQSVKPFATPRRIACLVTALAGEQPDQIIMRRGPALAAAYDAEGDPTPALTGFARSCGAPLDALKVEQTPKGEWLIYESAVAGAKTRELLPEMMKQVLASLPVVKLMRWGDGDFEFARPVHWAVMLYGNEVLACELFGVQTGRHTYGHRFHHPESVEIARPGDYEQRLQESFVIADFAKRRQVILQQIEESANKHHATALTPDALVDEVTAIVEWPETFTASFEADFLKVPAEALIAAMQVHQKCFALQDASGALLPYFVAVANIKSKNRQQVIAGNEKVMRARLSDAAFFFRQDKKLPLAHHIPATGKVIFQLQLGTLLEKARRIQVIMTIIAEALALNKTQAARAAELSKCDLMTGMVGEFPELQGLMGTYYALHDGEAPEVAIALQEQYLPRFSADGLPQTALGLALSLADRLDTLVGIFAIGQKPSGVRDPFKLRRHALAVVRLLISTPAQLDLSRLIADIAALYNKQFEQDIAVLAELHLFILERLQSWYQTQGIGSDMVQAVRARQANWLYDFDRRIKALTAFVLLPEAAALSAACKRVNNLLDQGQIKTVAADVCEKLLEESAEKTLYSQLVSMEKRLTPLYAQGDYGSILHNLASLREPVDAFFEQVMVMVDNESLKSNRLALLSRLQTILQGVADISLLQMAR